MLRRIQARARLTAALERTATREVEQALTRMGEAIAAKVREGLDWQGALSTAMTSLQYRLELAMKRAAIAGAADVAGGLPKASQAALERKAGPQVGYVSPYVLGWIRRHAAKQVTRIRATTAKAIRKQIIEGAKRGWGNAQIASAITKATRGRIGKVRALRIARTETHTAFERGSYEQAREVSSLGVELEAVWGSTEDARTRPDHAEANGQAVPVGKPFIVGGERLRFPGDPRGSARQIINCRCSALYYPKGTR